jgi:hypothetical protein
MLVPCHLRAFAPVRLERGDVWSPFHLRCKLKNQVWLAYGWLTKFLFRRGKAYRLEPFVCEQAAFEPWEDIEQV